MALTVWNVLRALAGTETGRSCRRCDESIPPQDQFGLSEGVCRPCRASDARGAEPRVFGRKPPDLGAEAHLRIMVEQMVREGRSERAIEAAVRQAA